MWKFLAKIKSFIKTEDGQALVEYGILVALIALVCIFSVQILGTQINQVFSNITANLATALSA